MQCNRCLWKSVTAIALILILSITSTTYMEKSSYAASSSVSSYYDTLTKTQQKYYNLLKDEITYENNKYECTYEPGNAPAYWNDMNTIVEALLKDNPEQFAWCWLYRTSTTTTNGKLKKRLVLDRYEPYPYEKKLNKKINQILTEMTATSTYGRVKYFHDYIMDHAEYDPKMITEGTPTDLYSHSPIGVLIKGIGVCYSYANAFKVLCDRVKIPCIIISNSDHAYNYVKMPDGKWYMVDLTWDDWIGGEKSHDYFLISNNPEIDTFNHDSSSSPVKSSKTDYSGSTYTKITKAPSLSKVSDGIKIKWSKIGASSGYRVYRKASNESSYKRIKTTTSRSFVDKNVKKGVTYTYKVRSFMTIDDEKHFFHYSKSSSIKK